MAIPRSGGSASLTSMSSIMIRPDDTFSSPAIMRRRVDLPQPDGPTRTQNSPSSTCRDNGGITVKLPKFLLIFSSFKRAMCQPFTAPASKPRTNARWTTT